MLGQGALDPLGSPGGVVFLSDPLRQLGGASLPGGVIDGGAARRRKTRRGELLRCQLLWTGPGVVHISPCSGDGGGIQGVRYPWVVATIGALLRLGTWAFTKGSTGGITVQAGQGLRPKPEGEAAHRGGQGTGQQAGEPSQGQGVWTALHEALAPSRALADAVVVDGWGLFTNRRQPQGLTDLYVAGADRVPTACGSCQW
jgi:hypothetical protein